MKKKYNEIINDLTDKELILHLYATQILLLAISLVLGIILFDGYSFWLQLKWLDLHILTIGVPAGIIVVTIDFILMKWLPTSYYDDGGLNEKIFRNRKFFQIVLIALLVAFSEEILFRGIIQTKIGLIWASLIFALIHYRYLFNCFLFLNIVFLSFLIGCTFYWTNNLVVTIVMHFIIDLVLGIKIKWENSKK